MARVEWHDFRIQLKDDIEVLCAVHQELAGGIKSIKGGCRDGVKDLYRRAPK